MLKITLPDYIVIKLSYVKSKLVVYLYKSLLLALKKVGVGLFNTRSLPVVFLDDMLPIELLSSEEECLVYSPCKYELVDPVGKAVIAPAVHLYLFQSAIVCPRSSSIIAGGKLVVEQIPYLDIGNCNYASGMVLYHNQELALVRCGEIKLFLEDGFFLGGNGSWNYYHWMTELVPKLEYYFDLNLIEKTKNIIVSSEAKNNKTFNDMLAHIFYGVDVNFIYLDDRQSCLVGSLYVVNAPNNILFNAKKKVCDTTYNFFRKKSLDCTKNIVFGMAEKTKNKCLVNVIDGLRNKNGNLNIFMPRKKGSARSYNQDAVESILVEGFGFKSIYVEDYSIEEQASIFANADFLVGASGAVWTNLIFCKPGALAISWLPSHMLDFSVYSTIAMHYKVKMLFVECIPHEVNMIQTSYDVPLDILSQSLKRLVVET